MYCIYHSRDLDGWMSAAIVKKALNIDGPIEMIGWDYGDAIPNLEPRRKVVMVDVSFPMEEMAKIAVTNRLIWIDHHKSAIKEFQAWDDRAKARWESHLAPKSGHDSFAKIAACELTWGYFFPKQPMPEIVRLLGSYDSFRHIGTEEEDKVFYFQYAARAFLNNPDECYKIFDELISVGYWVGVGKAILNYEKVNAESIYKGREEFVILDPDQDQSPDQPVKTFKVAAVNATRLNPKTFGIDFHKDGYDIFMSYNYNAKSGLFTVSIYNSNGKVDCSKIAKAHSGGGHAGAAGFQVSKGYHFLAELIQ